MPPGDKIRVVIVDDVSETRENVRKLLQFESDVDVVGLARTGKEAIQISQELNPDVVLMDINMPDMDGISATEAIRSKQPTVQVVILSVQSDQNYSDSSIACGWKHWHISSRLWLSEGKDYLCVQPQRRYRLYNPGCELGSNSS